jgi:hypothetical protein
MVSRALVIYTIILPSVIIQELLCNMWYQIVIVTGPLHARDTKKNIFIPIFKGEFECSIHSMQPV